MTDFVTVTHNPLQFPPEFPFWAANAPFMPLMAARAESSTRIAHSHLFIDAARYISAVELGLLARRTPARLPIE